MLPGLPSPTKSAEDILALMVQSSLIVHGGAGDWTPEDGAGEAVVASCSAAARAGFEVLRGGGSAVDAATAAVVFLEDDPLFNAGDRLRARRRRRGGGAMPR